MIHSRCGKRSPEGYAQAFSKRLLHLCPVGIIQTMIGSGTLETVQESLARHAMWKTQPPKSPLSGGLVTQFPPDKGG